MNFDHTWVFRGTPSFKFSSNCRFLTLFAKVWTICDALVAGEAKSKASPIDLKTTGSPVEVTVVSGRGRSRLLLETMIGWDSVAGACCPSFCNWGTAATCCCSCNDVEVTVVPSTAWVTVGWVWTCPASAAWVGAAPPSYKNFHVLHTKSLFHFNCCYITDVCRFNKSVQQEVI